MRGPDCVGPLLFIERPLFSILTGNTAGFFFFLAADHVKVSATCVGNRLQSGAGRAVPELTECSRER